VDANLISAFDVDDKAKIAAVLERLIRVSASPEKTE
jgi:hypothetical protein